MIINSLDKNDIESLYCHYTTLANFKCILKSGKLRFNLSTNSNDLRDTIYIQDVIREFNSKLKDGSEQSEFYKKLMDFYNVIKHKNRYKYYVACFTDKLDSRFLWDAYTVNKREKSNDSGISYNGVCICFKRESICNIIGAKKDSIGCTFSKIFYTKASQISIMMDLLEQAYDRFENNKEQMPSLVRTTRNVTYKMSKSYFVASLLFYESVDFFAPLFKHEFWEEESEYRAILRRDKNNNYEFIDMQITEDLIDHIILGPEFSENDENELLSLVECKLNFKKIKTVKSKGTGVIVSK